MDVDRFVAAHQATWARLDTLTARARHPRRLAPGEVDELAGTYQRVAGHLAFARARLPDPALVTRLTELVAAAHGVLYGERERSGGTLRRFVASTFPAAVWGIRRFVAVAAALLLVPALAFGVWIARSPAAFEATAPEAVRQAYLEEDFEAYYSSAPAAQFASRVFTNNVRVGVLAFASGVLGGVVTAWILVVNGANLGVVAGLFAAVGEQAKFWGLVLPHGLLELSAVVVAGAAGLRLGWTLIDPGDRTRLRALADEGRRCGAVAIGLVGAFAVAGLIEGFVTGRIASTAMRVGIGVAAAVVFWAYVTVLGRRAVEAGATGRLGEAPRPGP